MLLILVVEGGGTNSDTEAEDRSIVGSRFEVLQCTGYYLDWDDGEETLLYMLNNDYLLIASLMLLAISLMPLSISLQLIGNSRQYIGNL